MGTPSISGREGVGGQDRVRGCHLTAEYNYVGGCCPLLADSTSVCVGWGGGGVRFWPIQPGGGGGGGGAYVPTNIEYFYFYYKLGGGGGGASSARMFCILSITHVLVSCSCRSDSHCDQTWAICPRMMYDVSSHSFYSIRCPPPPPPPPPLSHSLLDPLTIIQWGH